MTTNRNTWKTFERRVSEAFNTRRNPLSGVGSGVTASDTRHNKLFIECKLRAKSPIHNLFEKTKIKAINENKIPLLALQCKYQKGFLVVCEFENLKDIVKELRS